MSKLRIGYISGHRAYGYGMQLAIGARNAVIEQGHTFIKIADQSEYHSEGNAYDYFHVAFDIARKMDFDAYIIPAGMIYQFCMKQTDRYSQEALNEIAGRSIDLIRSMDPKRTIVIERTFEGYRSIDKDNTSGMRNAIRHLIEECGYRRIAFISGPKYSNSAKIREGIYFEEMKAHGLETPERLFARGSYNGKCDDVVERLIEANDDIEAIACACDEIAFAVYRVMAKKGLAVGKSIAVTGYDDIPEAVHATPPLSTVHATGYDLGYMAGYEAVRLALGQPQKDRILESVFINRGSCGQIQLGMEDFFVDAIKSDLRDVDAVTEKFVEASFPEAKGSIKKLFYESMHSFCERMVEAYISHVAAPYEYIHLVTGRMVRSVLDNKLTRPYISVSGFQTAIDAFIHALRKVVGDDDKVWVADQAAHAHLQITRIIYDWHSFDISKFAEMEMDTIQIVDDALSESERRQTFEHIMQDISEIGIKHAEICVYEDPIAYKDKERLDTSESVLIKGWLDNEIIDCDNADELHSISGLFRRYENEDYPYNVFTVCALIAAGEVSGFVILEGETIDFEQQLAVVLLVSYAIKHLQMIDTQHAMVELLQENNIMLTNQSQQDEMTGLLNRRGFLFSVSTLLKRHVEKTAAVFFMDLDGLKSINDTHGHEVGDEAIKNTARVLTECLRENNLLARQGGDEFIAFAILRNPEDAAYIASRVNDKINEFNNEHELVYTLSVSVGYKAFTISEEAKNLLEQYMSEADAMLYEVKRKKKGAHRFELEKNR